MSIIAPAGYFNASCLKPMIMAPLRSLFRASIPWALDSRLTSLMVINILKRFQAFDVWYCSYLPLTSRLAWQGSWTAGRWPCVSDVFAIRVSARPAPDEGPADMGSDNDSAALIMNVQLVVGIGRKAARW